MAQHQVMEHRFACNELDCDYSFVSRCILQKTERTLFTLSIRYKLEEHVSQHHKKHLETNRNNVCQICSQGFTRPENLKKHRVRPHTFHCELCVKSFIAVDRLERHCLNEHRCLDLHSLPPLPGLILEIERSDGDRPGEKVLCEMCGKNFRQLHILRKHREIAHKYPCDLCDKRWVGWAGTMRIDTH